MKRIINAISLLTIAAVIFSCSDIAEIKEGSGWEKYGLRGNVETAAQKAYLVLKDGKRKLTGENEYHFSKDGKLIRKIITRHFSGKDTVYDSRYYYGKWGKPEMIVEEEEHNGSSNVSTFKYNDDGLLIEKMSFEYNNTGKHLRKIETISYSNGLTNVYSIFGRDKTLLEERHYLYTNGKPSEVLRLDGKRMPYLLTTSSYSNGLLIERRSEKRDGGLYVKESRTYEDGRIKSKTLYYGDSQVPQSLTIYKYTEDGKISERVLRTYNNREPSDRVEKLKYNEGGLLREKAAFDENGTLQFRVSYEFDKRGNVIKEESKSILSGDKTDTEIIESSYTYR